jgi:hypothetical protein
MQRGLLPACPGCGGANIIVCLGFLRASYCACPTPPEATHAAGRWAVGEAYLAG